MNNIYAIIGPPGCGKTTLLKEMLPIFDIDEIVSHTTRDKRKGEEEGITYYYVNKSDWGNFNFLEEVEREGNFFGLTKGEIEDTLDNNEDAIVIVDKYGLEQLKNLYPNKTISIYIYALPAECQARMKERGDSPDKIKDKMAEAYNGGEFDNHDIADYIISNHNGFFMTSKISLMSIIRRDKEC